MFGSRPLICRDFKITQRINDVPVATVRFTKSDVLALGAINYLDEVVIHSVSPKGVCLPETSFQSRASQMALSGNGTPAARAMRMRCRRGHQPLQVASFSSGDRAPVRALVSALRAELP